MDNFLYSLGYKYYGQGNLIKEVEIGHLKYVKPISIFGELLIEVHGSVCNPAKFYKGYTELVLKNSEYQELLHLKPRMESPQDRIIHSCLHFFAHAKEMFTYKLLKLLPRIKWQTLFDIVLLINKYGLNLDYLYKIAASNHCSLDLFFSLKMINYIIPGYINKEILLQLKSMGLESEAMGNLIFKQLLIYNLEGEMPKEKLINLIHFNYAKIITLSNLYQKIVAYCSNDVTIDIYVKITENEFIFLVKFKNVDLNYSSLVIHYTSINEETNDLALEKIVCSFKKNNEMFSPIVKMPYNKNYLNEIKASRIKEHGKAMYQYSIKKEMLIKAINKSPNKIISYSVHLEGENICLTGESWDDFKTMQHIKIST